MELNDNQKSALEHFEGPCMVIGTPGSGKTRVITERVRFLIEERGIKPTNILVITFTKAAAVEMRQRYYKMLGESAGKVSFGTFHSIFFTILRCAYHYTAENIIRDDMKRQVLKELVDDTDLEIQDENEFLNDLESEISKVKGERVDLLHYYSQICPGEVFRKIFQGYQSVLEKRHLIDFDDMLVYCYELLAKRPDIRKIWQQQYPFILIDEFQDINRVQYEVVKLLAEPYQNLFIVGDDDQSIYGFRGAKPDIMQQFLKDYPQAKRYLLGMNYRCSGAIVEAAGKLIEKNTNRLSKQLCAASEKGVPVEIRQFAKPQEENETVREKVLAYRKQGIPYQEMAVLFRTNTQARALTSKLMEYNIPFIMKERIPNIYEHWIAKDILTYLRIAGGSRERGDFLRIINRPKRYVHRNAFDEPYVDLEELKRFYEDKEWMVERLEQFEYDIKILATLKPYSAVNFIRSGIGYDEYIKEYAEYRGIRADDMMEILDELQEEARGKQNVEEWLQYIQEYGEELKEQTQKSRRIQNGQEAEQDAISILTMHGAKGLEYECVFLPDANEGVTPHNKAILDVDMEEERRMFYVAMTRAKKHLHIYYVKERFHKEADVSRFVQEIQGNEMAGSFDCESDLNHASMQMGKDYIYGETKLRYRRK